MAHQIKEKDIRLLLQKLMAEESPKKTYGVDGVERAMTEQEMDAAVNSGAITQDKSTYNIDGAERAMEPVDYDAAVSSGAITQDIAQPQPTNREFDKFPPGLGNDGTDPVPQDVSNMSPYGSLQGAESVGADETHTMPDGTVHPYSTHEEMMEALSRKQGIGGAELVGADPRGTRLGRGRY